MSAGDSVDCAGENSGKNKRACAITGSVCSHRGDSNAVITRLRQCGVRVVLEQTAATIDGVLADGGQQPLVVLSSEGEAMPDRGVCCDKW